MLLPYVLWHQSWELEISQRRHASSISTIQTIWALYYNPTLNSGCFLNDTWGRRMNDQTNQESGILNRGAWHQKPVKNRRFMSCHLAVFKRTQRKWEKPLLASWILVRLTARSTLPSFPFMCLSFWTEGKTLHFERK